MLKLFADRSLFQMAVQRLEGIFSPDKIYVVTVADQARELQAQCPQIPRENYLLEPLPRGTASVVGLASIALQQLDPQAVMAILTADHFIGEEERFRQLLLAAKEVAQAGYLVTLGIEPTFPATGYGYIQLGESLGFFGKKEVYRVLRFKEKPDETQAERMIASGDHAWNSGMFVWQVDRILQEFTRQMPQLASNLQRIAEDWASPQREATLAQIWPGIKSETIDYGIMEGASDVAVIPAAGLGWSDVGSWDSLFDVLVGDQDGNIVVGGEHIGLDTRQSLIFMDRNQRLVVTIGVEDLVLVDSGDVLLVCKKDQAQRVRQVVAQLRQSGKAYY
jgi:mannose-1-phosphate guanylyltransferase